MARRACTGDGHEHGSPPVTGCYGTLAVSSLAVVGQMRLHVEADLLTQEVDA